MRVVAGIVIVMVLVLGAYMFIFGGTERDGDVSSFVSEGPAADQTAVPTVGGKAVAEREERFPGQIAGRPEEDTDDVVDSEDRSASLVESVLAKRETLADKFRTRAMEEKAEAVLFAEEKGWPVEGRDHAGNKFEVRRVDHNNLLVYNKALRNVRPHNYFAGVSSAARNIIDQTPFLNREGASVLMGEWDAGKVLTNHVEFLQADGASRVIMRDASADNEQPDDHATHVAGTMVAAGLNRLARGMAPAAVLWSYDWDEDVAEWVEAAADDGVSRTNIYTSNHSYGLNTGWFYSEEDNSVCWAGAFGEREDEKTGKYMEESARFDEAIHAFPYTLAFFAMGNSRTDKPETLGLEAGQSYLRADALGEAIEVVYNPGDPNLPFPNDFKHAGMNTVSGVAVAKNVISIGAVMPGVENLYRDKNMARMSSFSNWGPTDDGRIKPDVVADGVEILSTSEEDPEEYKRMSGTSMASPSAAGTAGLLQDLHFELFETFMPAALLKGLLIHTATDIGPSGPDYMFGWGLIDAQAASDQIWKHFLNPAGLFLAEGSLSPHETNEYTFVWDGISPVCVTLCWTDPPYTNEIAGLNNPQSVLIHDLDVRVLDSDLSIARPWVLDPHNPTNLANSGDNMLDNVERVDFYPAREGEHVIRITHKGNLLGDQRYALLVSGQKPGAGPRFSLSRIHGGHEVPVPHGSMDFLGYIEEEALFVTNRIVNLGATNLVLTGTPSVSLAGSSAFSIDTPPTVTNLAPGEGVTFVLRFEPEVSDEHMAQLIIPHNEAYLSPYFCRVIGRMPSVLPGGAQGRLLVVTQHIAQAGTIADVTLAVSLTAESLETLTIWLVSPDQTEAVVVQEGVLQGTTLDQAVFSLIAPSPPSGDFQAVDYRGEFITPDDSFAYFIGEERAGDWVLIISNSAPDEVDLDFYGLLVKTSRPQLGVNRRVFDESAANNGSFDGQMLVVLENGTFSGDVLNHVTVHNLPEGLTPGLVRLDDSTVSLSLNGAASHHSRFDSVNNVWIEFGDAAFAAPADAGSVFNNPLLGVMVNFRGEGGVNPSGIGYGWRGGSAQLRVSAPWGEMWTAQAVAEWLEITGGQSGYGNGVVTVASVANDSRRPRTSVVTVAGEEVSVRQSGHSTGVSAPAFLLLEEE